MVDVTAPTTPFDAVDDLVAAGFDEPRAKAVVRLVEGRRSDLVTKADLEAGLDAQDARLDAKLGSAVNRMLIAQIVIAGLLFTALQLAARVTS